MGDMRSEPASCRACGGRGEFTPTGGGDWVHRCGWSAAGAFYPSHTWGSMLLRGEVSDEPFYWPAPLGWIGRVLGSTWFWLVVILGALVWLMARV